VHPRYILLYWVHCLVGIGFSYCKGYFILGIMIKETQELSNPISGELKIGPKNFTLPMWYHFDAKCSWS
jgi:biotin transporter BioY